MGKSARIVAWFNLASGLLFLLKFARDTWAPAFLSLTGRHQDSWVSVPIGLLFIIGACRGFMNMRRVSTR